MSELRQDPLTGRWTIVAPRRSGRPRDHAVEPVPRRPAALPAYDPDCPFCPGGEAEQLVPLLVLPDLAGGGWAGRIVPNSFPALSLDPGAPSHPEARLGLGRHEVIIETPRHDADLADMAPAEFLGVIELTMARMRQLTRDPEVKALFVFRNSGAKAGSSLVHPHGQVMSLPFVPTEQARREAHLAESHRRLGRNPFRAALEAECGDGRRILAENADFVLYVPFAPEASCELRLQHRAGSADPFDIDSAQIRMLANLLQDGLDRLKRLGGDPAYNLVWMSMSRAARRLPFAGWCVRVIPRTVSGGAFEMAAGMAILSSTPEADAARLRGDVDGS